MAEIVPSHIATWHPFATQGSLITQRDIISVHTMVGSLAGSFSWASSKGTRWQFGTSGTGECWQCQGLERKSGANLNGNWHVIAIENADMGPGFGPWNGQCGHVPPFTKAQVDKLVQLIAYLCALYDIPPVLIPDTKVGRRGISYHRQGIDPWRCSNCEKWSNATGKCCPDGARINQLVSVIIPRVRALIDGKPQPPEEDDMPLNDADKGWISGQIMRALSWLTTGQGNAFVNVKTAPWTATAPSLTSLAARTAPALIAQVEGDPQVWLVNPAGGTKVKLNGWDTVDVAVFLGASQAGPRKPHKLPASYMAQLAEIA